VPASGIGVIGNNPGAMFSHKIYVDIARVTKDALNDIPGHRTVDQVTTVLGYVSLSSCNVAAGYDMELKASVERLLEVARRANRPQLITALEALLQEMDEQRAAEEAYWQSGKVDILTGPKSAPS
jgi:hypothetical protein